jgi:hypothetical protein
LTATTCCLGVRLEPDGRWRIYAPHGLSDVFNLVVRPNPVLAPQSAYEAKTSRWHRGPSSLSYPGQPRHPAKGVGVTFQVPRQMAVDNSRINVLQGKGSTQSIVMRWETIPP